MNKWQRFAIHKWDNNMSDWRPHATIETLRFRASCLRQIRTFFDERGVLEVETPILGHYGVTDSHIENFVSDYFGKSVYLQSSPEYHMKRLLAAGSGSIYQMAKAFRLEGTGRRHNPEFTLLEWYRVDFDYHQLMDEVSSLLTHVLTTAKAEKRSYQSLFMDELGVCPFNASFRELKACIQSQDIAFDGAPSDRAMCLDWLMSMVLEPNLGLDRPCIIYDYPQSMASLAKIDGHIACRFEVYYKGLELANGFDELQDANTQRARFMKDNEYRRAKGQMAKTIDELFLCSLRSGLPDCSGVALGVDRLVMLAANKNDIREVLGFSIENA